MDFVACITSLHILTLYYENSLEKFEKVASGHCPIKVKVMAVRLHIPQYKPSRPVFQHWHLLGSYDKSSAFS